MIAGSFEVKLPTLWTDEAAEVGRVRGRERTEKEDQRRERVGRKNSNMREKVEKVAKHCFSNVLWLRQEVRKVGSLKRQVRSHLVG